MDLFLGRIAPRRYWWAGDRQAEGFEFVAIEGADPPETEIRTGPFGHRLMSGLHQSIATLAGMGHHVVVDHVLWERRWLEDCVATLQEHPILFVGVHCPLAVAEARLYARADRPAILRGTTRWHFPRIHTYASYDLEVDTSTATPMECAVRIKRHLDEGLPMTAIQRLAARNRVEHT